MSGIEGLRTMNILIAVRSTMEDSDREEGREAEIRSKNWAGGRTITTTGPTMTIGMKSDIFANFFIILLKISFIYLPA